MCVCFVVTYDEVDHQTGPITHSTLYLPAISLFNSAMPTISCLRIPFFSKLSD